MGAPGIREFIKWYYPQLRKEGLIVDVRANGGGNVSRMLIERLAPEAAGDAVLANESRSRAVSDGDVHRADGGAAERELVVGRRHLPRDVPRGGARPADRQAVVGRRGRNHQSRHSCIDGGMVNVPEFGFANLKGEWIIEGHGVDPDIEVENDPKSVIQGKDPQLERGVAELMKKLKADPVAWPKRPADPVKLK